MVQKIVYMMAFLFFLFFLLLVFCYFRNQIREKKKQELDQYLHNWHIKRKNQNVDVLVLFLKKDSFFSLFTSWWDELSKEQREDIYPYVLILLEKLLGYVRNASISYQVKFLNFLVQYPKFLEGKGSPLISYVVECTISNHFALVDYSFLVINRFGNSSLLRKTLMLMNQHSIEHNSKLLTNSLLQFGGDTEKMKENLVKDLKKYMVCYAVSCIDYLGYQKLDVSQVLLDLVVDPKKDKEIKIACLRYFARVKVKPAVAILYDYLKNDVISWECAAIAAKALENYPSKETNNRLLEALGSYSWFVRNNAAKSLVQNNKKEVIKEILRQIKDKYAYEALKYQLQLQEKGN